jgi:beta-glucosidase
MRLPCLIGPNADHCILGGYLSAPKDSITPLRTIKEKYGDRINILYSEGLQLTNHNSSFSTSTSSPSKKTNHALPMR